MKNEYSVPKLTLSDLYDENIVYNSRPSYALNPWLIFHFFTPLFENVAPQPHQIVFYFQLILVP
jgi:hypothetical protein